jgi:hypothetical protein
MSEPSGLAAVRMGVYGGTFTVNGEEAQDECFVLERVVLTRTV